MVTLVPTFTRNHTNLMAGASPKNGEDLIELFEAVTDQTTELSDQEELDLLNRIYREVLEFKAWEFLKKPFEGVCDGTGSVDLPDDFGYIFDNYQTTDLSYSEDYPKRVLVYINGPDVTPVPYRIVNFSDRRTYRNQQNICWVDLVENTLTFAIDPGTGISFEYDYIFVPDDLALDTYPVFPSRFHPLISFGMASDDAMMQMYEKIRSYAPENQAKMQTLMSNMAYWNDQFIQIT